MSGLWKQQMWLTQSFNINLTLVDLRVLFFFRKFAGVMKKKLNMENITGEFKILFNEFKDWDEFPARGTHIYNDSGVFEFEFTDGFFTFNVRARITVIYKRYFFPETIMGPEEDDILDYEFDVETCRGERLYKDESMEFSDIEKEQSDLIIKQNLNIS